MLTQLPKLEEFVYVVNEGSRGIVEDVIQEFKLRVLDNLSIFQKQMIHGDFHDQNILVGKSSSNAEYKVTGILDFGDTQFCCLLFDIAIALTHILLTSGNIEYGGYLLAGYKITRLIPEHEWKVLKVSYTIIFNETTIFKKILAALCLCPTVSNSGVGFVHLPTGSE